jgi:hypothetical protein
MFSNQSHWIKKMMMIDSMVYVILDGIALKREFPPYYKLRVGELRIPHISAFSIL